MENEQREKSHRSGNGKKLDREMKKTRSGRRGEMGRMMNETEIRDK